MNKQVYAGSIGIAAALIGAFPSFAQNLPTPAQIDPGASQRRSLEQRRDIEQQTAPREAPTEPVQVEKPPVTVAPPPARELRFVLKAVKINDSAFLSRDELTEIVRPYLNTTVGFDVLQQMVDKINALYRARGVGTAQAVLPPQDIENGTVRIELVEGRLGELRLSGNTYTRDNFIRERLPLEAGTVVDTDALQQSLIRFNRTSDIQLKAALQPGTGHGLTDIEVAVQEPERNSIQLFLDNQGTKSTGLYQLGVLARRNGMFGWDDQASAYLVRSRGTLTGSLNYGIPVNRSNGRLSISYARNTLEIVKGPFSALGIEGTSSTMALNFKQPFKVEANSQWDLVLTASRSDSNTDISGVSFSESKVDKLSIGTNYDSTTAWGRWMTAHALSTARVDSSTETWPSFLSYTGSANVLMPVGDRYTLAMNFGWQWLNKEQAPASELYQLGGLSSVRGYAPGILSGARGYHAQFEVHRPFTEEISGFAFIDTGLVTPEPKQSITGVGVGISYRGGKRWSLDANYGVPLNKVVPDQDSGRLDLRLVLNF